MMKNNRKSSRLISLAALVLVIALASVMVGSAVMAEERATGVEGDANPAIMVTQKTSKSVVGVVTNVARWDQQNGETTVMVAQGSGVVIGDGTYVLTNNHVIADGNSHQVVLPSGENADATLVGADESTDLAVLKVDSNELVPVEIGSSSNLLVGSTVIAIGNPGGTVLANTVTSGIVSALERTSVSGNNATRAVSYIQHDAAINSGNSGGGLFDINGRLIGINTLKYMGSVFSGATFEGLGFAIPIDMAYPIAQDLIQYGKVLRPQMGVMVASYAGPESPMPDYPPASVCVHSVTEGGPADKAGIKQYDFITEINGVRVQTLQELTTQMDLHKAGDTVELTVVRYSDVNGLVNNSTQNYGYNDPSGGYYSNPFDDFFGNYGGNYGGNYRDNSGSNNTFGRTYETLKIQVTLEVPQAE